MDQPNIDPPNMNLESTQHGFRDTNAPNMNPPYMDLHDMNPHNKDPPIMHHPNMDR
jgi:hypothetical protein